MTTSIYTMNTTNNYDIITKALIYKQLNPPQYTIHHYNINSYFGTELSKGVLLRFNVQGKGIIRQYFIYNINNKLVKYRQFFYSEEQRQQNMIKNKKKMLGKERYFKKKEENREENK